MTPEKRKPATNRQIANSVRLGVNALSIITMAPHTKTMIVTLRLPIESASFPRTNAPTRKPKKNPL